MLDARFTETLALVRVALMAALITVGSWISLPIGPVPLTLQNFFVMIAGLWLGPRQGLYAMLLFVGAGCLGLPVFAGGKAGVGVLLGPTGGYLMGYLVLVVLCGLRSASLVRNALLLTLGSLAVYAFGIWRLMATLNLTPEAAISAGMLPFLPGDGLKIVAALALWRLQNRRNRRAA